MTITIPPEAWQAAMRTYHREVRRNPGNAWQAAIRAGIEAWPGMKWHEIQVPDNSDEVRYMLKKTGIILPLTTESSDD